MSAAWATCVKEGEAVECRVLAIDPDEQRMSLSIKAHVAKPAAAAGESVDAESSRHRRAPPPPKKRTTPLRKGGLGERIQPASNSVS